MMDTILQDLRFAARQLLKQPGFRLAVIGLALGLAIALMVTRLLDSFLYGVTASDPITFAVVVVVVGVFGIAMLATLLPARRATRVSPIDALRHE